jgi:hypothetical protein
MSSAHLQKRKQLEERFLQANSSLEFYGAKARDLEASIKESTDEEEKKDLKKTQSDMFRTISNYSQIVAKALQILEGEKNNEALLFTTNYINIMQNSTMQTPSRKI